MSLPDPEALRREYNDHYRQPVDRWSCHTPETARALVGAVLEELEQHGFVRGAETRILDVGCAKGHISEAFRLTGAEVHGIDYSDVAIAEATRQFPGCRFHHADAFNPRFAVSFDLVFMRGFSGCNTLSMESVAALANAYVELLHAGGWLVIGNPTDFSGLPRAGQTANWGEAQIHSLAARVDAPLHGRFTIPRQRWTRALRHAIARAFGRSPRHYLYLCFRKAPDSRHRP